MASFLISQPAKALRTMTAPTIRRPAVMVQPKKRGVGSGITGFLFLRAIRLRIPMSEEPGPH